MFTAVRSSTGALEVAWRDDPEVASLEAWVLLVDPDALDPASLDRQAFMRELIRVPLAPRAGQARVYVPVDRALGLALVARDAAGQALAPRDFTIAAPLAAAEREATSLAGPAARDVASLERALAERLAVPAPRTLGPTGFGMRQRWTSSRLAFTPEAGPAPRLAVVRPTFIHEDEIRAWADAPPADAIALPPDADGLIDAATPDDAMAFYVVLEGPAPWRPLTLSPVPPPFDATRRPHVIGDGRARAAELARTMPADGPARELVQAAIASLERTEAP